MSASPDTRESQFVTVLNHQGAFYAALTRELPLSRFDHGVVAFDHMSTVLDQYTSDYLSMTVGRLPGHNVDRGDTSRDIFCELNGTNIGVNLPEYSSTMRFAETDKLGMNSLAQITYGSGELIKFNKGEKRVMFPVSRHSVVHGYTIGRTSADNDTALFISTNHIHPDAYGELNQLKDRQNDLALMNAVLESTKRFSDVANPDYDGDKPDEYFTPFSVFRRHIEWFSIWDNPPQNTDELINRISYLLHQTAVDDQRNRREGVMPYAH